VLLQVYSRLAPGTAPRWTVEMGSILLGALIWMGLGSGVETGSHIRFDMLIALLPPRYRRWFDLAANLFFAAFLILLSIYTMQMLIWYGRMGSKTTLLGWNKGWTKLPMFVGLVVAAVRVLYLIVVGLLAWRRTDAPPEGTNEEGDTACPS
ncbi:MAG: TRAP transporter small permease, partial [Planctomycetes bacterium]|nr:TRAP transporter small permease [Planctomycetota bacterium]